MLPTPVTATLTVCLLATAAWSAPAKVETVFEEDFSDPKLPAWTCQLADGVRVTAAAGPDGAPAVCFERTTPGAGQAHVTLPVKQIAGRPVLLDVWIRADGVKTGEKRYFNAKTMLIYQAGGVNSLNPGVTYTDFFGTFDWRRHRYVVKFPDDLEAARLVIGLQACSGKAYYSKLSLKIDPRIRNQHVLDRVIEREKREHVAALVANGQFRVDTLPGGAVQVRVGDEIVPLAYWDERICEQVVQVQRTIGSPATGFDTALATAVMRRWRHLAAGLDSLQGMARASRAHEIRSLAARATWLTLNTGRPQVIHLKPSGKARAPVSRLIFGNNINWGEYSNVYQPKLGGFAEEFLQRVRPMGITCLRYPGGCNADVFDWRDSLGPVAKRRHGVYYQRGNDMGPAVFGVDEYLRFCEQEGMEPLITTPFLWDDPRNIKEHPRRKRCPYIPAYLRTAPERVKLAVDWVEYCNGSTDTPMGKLRAANGHPEPYGVKYWEIGNETWGADRVGSCDADVYAREFPKYVRAMKERDPTVWIGLNGAGHKPDWNETILRIAGKQADFIQVHYYTGGSPNEPEDPAAMTPFLRGAERPARGLAKLREQMQTLVGRALPIAVSEYGMGASATRRALTGMGSSVLVADMVRVWLEAPDVFSANRWCLYSNYFFTAVNGPSRGNTAKPYWCRPDQAMFAIYARVRGDRRLPMAHEGDTVRSVVFERQGEYGVMLMNRDGAEWSQVQLELPGLRAGDAKAWALTAGHPLIGNDEDHALLDAMPLTWQFRPRETISLPPCSVVGVLVPQGK